LLLAVAAAADWGENLSLGNAESILVFQKVSRLATELSRSMALRSCSSAWVDVADGPAAKELLRQKVQLRQAARTIAGSWRPVPISCLRLNAETPK
jgi:hypothetical protein